MLLSFIEIVCNALTQVLNPLEEGFWDCIMLRLCTPIKSQRRYPRLKIDLKERGKEGEMRCILDRCVQNVEASTSHLRKCQNLPSASLKCAHGSIESNPAKRQRFQLYALPNKSVSKSLGELSRTSFTTMTMIKSPRAAVAATE